MLSPWKESYDKSKPSIKSRDITLLKNVHIVKAIVFSEVIYGFECCTIKNDEQWRIDAFKLWCWKRLLRPPWAARRSNKPIIKETNPEHLLEGLLLKLKLQYFGLLMEGADSLEMTLMLGKVKDKRRKWQRMRWLDGNWMNMNLSKFQEIVETVEHGVLHFIGSQRVRHNLVAEKQQQQQ